MYLKHPSQTNSLFVFICSCPTPSFSFSLSSLNFLSLSRIARTVIGCGALGTGTGFANAAAFARRRRDLTDSPPGLERNRPPLPRTEISTKGPELLRKDWGTRGGALVEASGDCAVRGGEARVEVERRAAEGGERMEGAEVAS